MDATNQRPGDAFQGPSQELPSIEVCPPGQCVVGREDFKVQKFRWVAKMRMRRVSATEILY